MPTNIQTARRGTANLTPRDLTDLDAAIAGSGVTEGAGHAVHRMPIVEKQLARVREALAPYDHGHGYLNFRERDVDARTLSRREYAYRRPRAARRAPVPAT